MECSVAHDASTCGRQRNKLDAVRAIVDKLRKTPLHPQWFALRHESSFIKSCCAELDGIVVDIGCAAGRPQHYLPAGASYLGMDYFATATEWYETRPNIYADAQALPLREESVDHALLLDVMEHLPEPERCLAEIHRVLKPQGSLTLQVPFIYPIHDAPLDFHRWTQHGLERAALRHGFEIGSIQAVGHPASTAALITNIAMSKTVLNWIHGKNPLALLAIILPVAVVTVNCVGWLAAALSRTETMMPFAYRAILRKA